MSKIIDGKKIARQWESQIAQKINALSSSARRPTLAVVLVGEDPASKLYVEKKSEACKRVGIESIVKIFNSAIDQNDLLIEIQKLNSLKIDGILVQLPLPKHINPLLVMAAIDPKKDVDGMHPLNIGKLSQNRQDAFHCCTPKGIMYALRQLDITLQGIEATIIGQSNIVGRPMMMELLNAQCTVNVCHHLSQDIEKYTRSSKLIISATGRPHLIGANAIAEGSIVIDVGTSIVDGKTIGDVNFKEVYPKAAHITPVPGGVGPLTISALLDNTLISFEMTRAI